MENQISVQDIVNFCNTQIENMHEIPYCSYSLESRYNLDCKLRKQAFRQVLAYIKFPTEQIK
jgi:hypothetical protein